MHAADVPLAMMRSGALALLAVAGLTAAAMSGAGGRGPDASAGATAPQAFATYSLAGAPEPVGLPAGTGVATLVPLRGVSGVAVAADGSVLVVERAAHRVDRIDPQGRLSTVAGTGREGFSGDGGPAVTARLRRPTAVAPLPDGGLLVADSGNNRIRRVFANGTIRTVAACRSGAQRSGGGRAVAPCLSGPRGVASLPDGGFLIADTGNDRIRRVSRTGRITTIAGGRRGFRGDGGSARRARLRSPSAVAVLPGGGFAIADTGNRRVRIVSARGVIRTVAGGGRRAPAGAPAVRARLGRPVAVAAAGDGELLVADAGDTRFAITAALYRLTRGGTLRTVLGSEGVVGARGQIGRARAIGAATTRDGGVAIADGARARVLLIAPREADRLAVRLGPDRLVLDNGEPLETTILATRTADVDLRVTREGVAIHEEHLVVRPGAATRTLLPRTEPGRYRVELVAREGDRVFTDTLDVEVSGGNRIAEPAGA